MRLKIKPVQPPTSPELQCQENRQALDVIDPDEAPRMADVKEEEDHQWLVPVENIEENPIAPPELPPPTPVVDQYLGKRKRKPKELIDEVSPILFRRKKKPGPVPKSENVIPDGGKRNASKREDGSSNLFVKSPTLIRAEEVMASLGNEYPCFMKLLVRSHVASCFWMGLPVPFCKAHLPKKDCAVALESENGERFEIKYIAEKTGLSAGWRKFVAAHKLVEGDVLVFQLVMPTTFKMMVIRSHDLSEVDGALSLLNLDAFTKQSDANALALEGTSDSRLKRKRRPKSLPLTVVQKKKQKSHLDAVEEHSGNDSDEVASEVLEGSKLSIDALRFRDIKSFEDFHITVNGVCIDSELPDMVRRKYYDLCCSKNLFIHERFLPGLHSKLAAGMIYEAVSTADAIKACQVTTSIDEFEKWEKSLRSFELLGMNVGFLHARLSRLRSLAFDFEGALETKKYWEVVNDRSTTEDEISKLEIKLVELRELAVKQDNEIEGLKSMAENYELMFQEEVNAPW